MENELLKIAVANSIETKLLVKALCHTLMNNDELRAEFKANLRYFEDLEPGWIEDQTGLRMTLPPE